MISTLLAVALALYVPQRDPSQPLEPPLEGRVQQLGKELRCAVCQGVSIADSPASMARAQLDMVRQLVSEGKTDQEVRDYFIARYGEWVLLEPKKEGLNLLVWLGPIVLLVLGGWVIIRQVKPGSAPSVRPEPAVSDRPEPVEGLPSTPPANADPIDPYLAAVRAEVEK